MLTFVIYLSINYHQNYSTKTVRWRRRSKLFTVAESVKGFGILDFVVIKTSIYKQSNSNVRSSSLNHQQYGGGGGGGVSSFFVCKQYVFLKS